MALTEINQMDVRIRHTLGSREDCTGWKALSVAVMSHMAGGSGSCTPRALTPCLMLSPTPRMAGSLPSACSPPARAAFFL